jgi:hypothetical protein
MKVKQLIIATVLAIGLPIAATTTANATSIGGGLGMLSSYLSGLDDVDPGLLEALETVNNWLPVIDKITSGQTPTVNDVVGAYTGGDGITANIGGYQIGIDGAGFVCNAVDADGNINLQDKTCDKAATAISTLNDGTAMSTSKLAMLAAKLGAAGDVIDRGNKANAQATKAANEAVANNAQKTGESVTTNLKKSSDAVSTFDRTAALVKLQATQANVSVQTNNQLVATNSWLQTTAKIATANYKIATERVNAERAEADRQDLANERFVKTNPQNQREVCAALGQYC